MKMSGVTLILPYVQILGAEGLERRCFPPSCQAQGEPIILEGRIEPDNMASLACRSCRFTFLPDPDADGLIQVVYKAPRHALGQF
ncbi:hypothetical protein EV131_13322 [Rhizobium laguerreae]|uniref:Uncharacterized protein n=1 Tax=Rhizobium laguerreae TaxID=1076926 RepID=A0AAX2QA20_9HYPH|nr:hypothetical protein EV131_13322 [Rhizobium laguerreae]